MTSNSLKGLDLDTVIVAAGSSPLLPDVPGINGLNHITGVDLLKNDIKTKEKCVAVVGGGILGCEMALHLGYQGNKVILLEMLPNLAQDMDPISQRDILIKLEEAGVGIKTNARLIGVEKDSLVFQDQQCKDRTFLIDSDLTVLCLGGKSNDSLSLELEGLFPEVYTIGDAKKPRKIIDAIYEGFLVANTI